MTKRRWLRWGIIAGIGWVLWRQIRQQRTQRCFPGRKGQPKRAMITGASSGIGAEFARQLAAAGYDLILVARREEKLVALAEELQTKQNISAEVIVADLANPTKVEHLANLIAAQDDLTLLVNNAGFGTVGDLIEVDVKRQVDMLNVHMTAPMQLSKAALPQMVARQHGFIINVSSIAGFMTTGGNVNYAASKAYLNNFSQSLQAELDGTGVQVQALCPGFTHTGFHDTSEYEQFTRSQIPDQIWMTAKEVVQESLSALNREQVIVIPGWYNQIFAIVRHLGLSRYLRDIRRKIFE